MNIEKLRKLLINRYKHLPEEYISHIIASFFKQIADALMEDKSVELRGFGKFYVRKIKARKTKHPQNDSILILPATKYPAFKTSNALKIKITEKA